MLVTIATMVNFLNLNHHQFMFLKKLECYKFDGIVTFMVIEKEIH